MSVVITSGLELKLRRIRLGLKQYAVANRAGMSQTALCLMESGRAELSPEKVDVVLRAMDEMAGEPRAGVGDHAFAVSA